MTPSTYYAVLLALVMGVGCASTSKDTIEAAQKALYEGHYADAIPYIAAELAKEEAKPVPESSRLSHYNQSLGHAHSEAGRFEKALSFYHKALVIRLEDEGPNGLGVANCYNNIGEVHAKKREGVKALEYCLKSLAIVRVLVPDSEEFALNCDNIGSAYNLMGEPDKALEYFQKGRDVRLKQFGPDQIDFATTYFGMAIAYGAKKNVIKEKEFLRKAYAIQLEQRGKDHPDTKRSKAKLDKIK